jgi:NADH:ubiquinone oxidoreductase subunit F (NADH-binding)/NADH:ubiquinone oxidoreductase subunit E
MTTALRRYREARRGEAFPLLALHDHLRRHGPLDPAATQSLADSLGLPPAAIRAAASSYAELTDRGAAFHVCRGTSCELAGAAELQDALAAETDCRAVYCLGYCDRSPAVLRPDHTVVASVDPHVPALSAAPAADPAPAIRSLVDPPIVTERIGRGDFADLGTARAAGVYAALVAALGGPPAAVLDAVERSGERGRGGAGFPTGVKWRACASAPAEIRYVVANGDEGDPGSFIDRVLMEQDPHALIEGMALCAYAVGASEGIIFIRSEYPRAVARVRAAVEAARAAGILGTDGLGSSRGFDFDITVFPALGSYVCGEETAMLSAIEGFRGEVRLRPPHPAVSGLYGRPTVVNNVETLVNIPWIVRHGPEAFAARGTAGSRGTKALCLNHGFARPGIVEVAFGIPLGEVIEDVAGGGAGGRPLAAVIIGGPMGSIVGPEDWDVPLCYQAMGARGIQLGHGGLVALPEGTDWGALLAHWLTFMQHESCGKCVPCRLGSARAREIAAAPDSPEHSARLRRLFEVMEEGSLCAFGQLMPAPMRQILDRIDGDRIDGDRIDGNRIDGGGA